MFCLAGRFPPVAPLIHLRKSTKIVSAQGRQTLFVIPAHVVKQAPSDPVAEFTELDIDRLLVKVVHRGLAKEHVYGIVFHNRAAQVSIPRWWLQNVGAQPGDEVQLWEDTAQPDRLLLRFAPTSSDPAKAAALATPVYKDFRE